MSWVIILIYIAIAIVSLYFGFRAGVELIVAAIRKNPNKMLTAMGIKVVRRVEHEDTTKRGSRAIIRIHDFIVYRIWTKF